jgi:hypothetical protein
MAKRDTAGMAQRVLERHGIPYEVKRGKHIKIVMTYKGERRTLVTGASVSDHRAIQNCYGDLKRLLTGMGVEFQDCKALLFN